MLPIVSVIVPIYNVECFIEKCVISLMEQTLTNIEYIFVDDCTPDNSIIILKKILKKYPHRLEQVKVIVHDHNKGLPAARNTGLEYAVGKYIYHCDSDDYIEKEMLEQMVNEAEDKQADMVWCDFWLTYENKERYMQQPLYTMSEEALKGVLSGKMKYNVWNKLVRHSLYLDNHIDFPSGHGMGEDMTMIKLLTVAKKIAYVPRAFYHYIRTNVSAFTQTMSERHLSDVKHNTDSTITFVKQVYGDELNYYISLFQLDVKLPLLMTADEECYIKWLKWFPESHLYIMKNTNISKRMRYVQYMASKHQFWFVKMHFYMHGFIYRMLYQ